MRRRALLLTLAAAGLALAACGPSKKAQENLAAADAFMAQNAKAPGVVTLPQGLQYKVVRANPSGEQPKPGDEVKVNYEGTLVDGSVFDSSYKAGAPVIFPIGGLIEGWNEALPMMHVGEEWILVVPPKLGYGADAKPGIPANSVLVFRIELLGMLSKPNANV